MTKTPEQLAEEYSFNYMLLDDPKYAMSITKKAFLAGYQAAKDQLADGDKVMCNTTMEEIKAVDTGELMPITNLPTSAKWISVRERLPEWHEDVLAITVHCSFREMKVVRYEPNYGFDFNGIIAHWMPLPEPPKENE